jgi:hypothetical protein
LPRRIAQWFFGGLSGQPVTLAPSADRIGWPQWLGFILVSTMPAVACEVYLAKRIA